VAGEVLHPGDRRELEEVEDPHGQDVPPAGELVAAVGRDAPAGGALVPLGAGHACVEERVVGEVEAIGDGLEVLLDLLAVGVAVLRHVAELLQHRQVDVRLHVAHHPRVLVPVPGAPDPAGLVDEPDPLDPRLAEVGAGRDARDPRADDHDVDLLGHRLPLDPRGERVGRVVAEVLVGGQVADVGPAREEPLVALGQVLRPDGLGVERR
jgi:hypothetical protein